MTDILPDPIESTWPTLKKEHLDLASFHLYQIVKPGDGLAWDDLSPAQKEDYRRRILLAARATAADPCPTIEQIATWAKGGMTAGERAALIRHSAGCDSCLQVIGRVFGQEGARNGR